MPSRAISPTRRLFIQTSINKIDKSHQNYENRFAIGEQPYFFKNLLPNVDPTTEQIALSGGLENRQRQKTNCSFLSLSNAF
jgi:hypothetical protein